VDSVHIPEFDVEMEFVEERGMIWMGQVEEADE
jgi:hypothetical protein